MRSTASVALIAILSCLMNTDASSEYESQQQTQGTNETFSLAEDCLRECGPNVKPLVCYYKFTLELYETMSRACDYCKPSDTNPLTNTPQCQCIEADGFERALLSVNRMLPGPSIQVCKRDTIVVDVMNKMPGMSTTLHWHGVLQRQYQYYDGVPFVTQCPIEFGSSFRYKYAAEDPGTHFWHAHNGLQKINGLYGSLVIREPTDPHANLYDKDEFRHVILLSDWQHELGENRLPGRYRNRRGQSPETVLINGKGRWTDPSTNKSTSVQLSTFTVKYGLRYRFRLINSFSSTCSAEITIEGHSLQLIAQDGASVHPVIVNVIKIWSGERADVVLNANSSIDAYWIHVKTKCGDKEINQLAILRYEGGPDVPETPQSGYQLEEGAKILYNPDDGSCDVDRSHAICPNQLTAIEESPDGLLTPVPDYKLRIPYRFVVFDNRLQDLFAVGQYQRYMVSSSGNHLVAVLNNISFVFPKVPPLIQSTNADDTCNENHLPQSCGSPCECTHTYHVKKGAVVEMLLWDEDSPSITHAFHLHGHQFHVFSIGLFVNGSSSEDNINGVLSEHKRKLETGEYSKPPGKDTIAVPTGGWAIIRFIANNPGWWLFHCHFLYHINIGMDLLFHVGDESDLPPIPAHLRKCGDFA